MSRFRKPLLLTVGITFGVAAAGLTRALLKQPDPPTATVVAAERTRPPADPPPQVSVAAARGPVWQKAKTRLVAAAAESRAALDRRLAEIDAFAAGRVRAGAKPFADEIVSDGTTKFAWAKTFGGGDRELATWVAGRFNHHLFTAEDFRRAVTAAAAEYLADLQRVENDLLVAVYTDAEVELHVPPEGAFPGLRRDANLQGALDAVAGLALQAVDRDFKAAVGQQAAALVVSYFAEQVVVRVIQAAAARLGVSAGILGTGAASSVATLGVGFAVSYVVDLLLDAIRRNLFGYNPEADIAAAVERQVRDLGRQVVDGSPDAPALRHHLTRIHTVRALARAAALHKVVWGESPAGPAPDFHRLAALTVNPVPPPVGPPPTWPAGGYELSWEQPPAEVSTRGRWAVVPTAKKEEGQ